MAEKLIDPQSPVAGESAARTDSLAARAGRAVRRLAERMRVLGDLAGAGLGPTVQTVRRDLGDAFGHLRRARHLGIIVAGAVLVLYVLSGTYVVSPGEVAVVTRFGKVVQARVTPGLRWYLPWPVEAAWTVNVAQVRREGIGVTFPGHPAVLHPPEDIQLLTGDENLLAAKAIVQYRIKAPADYLFRIDYNEDPLLRAVVKAALIEIAGGMQVDALLTSGRTEFQQQARDRAQQTLDAYRSGLDIVSIDFQEIAPPGDVVQAFRDVASAREEKNKLINDAQGYANSVIPQARGEAQKRLREAEGYQADVVNRARGEAQRFTDVVAQYRRDALTFGPEVTRYRLYVETMEQTLPKAKKYIVEPGKNGEQVNLRILEPLPAAPPPASGRP
ncbi:MAG: FtsH protease activity modulator HflK [Candidatus Entotheonellia bacterium]